MTTGAATAAAPELHVSSRAIGGTEMQAQAEARDWFFAYRRYMRPTMLWNWWVEEVSLHLQLFYEAFMRGERPRMAIEAPPQHGKSMAVEDFIAWVAGKNPELKTIFASYSDELGIRCNVNLQRTFRSERYRATFGRTRVDAHGWQCNTSLIEYVRHEGSFRNVTVNGAVNGLALHLGVVDDPFKGRAEARSKTIRDRTWDWFTDDYGTRFDKNSAMLIIMTRWHVDDLIGRLHERDPSLQILHYPAIAVGDEVHRERGEALFAEHKPLEFLLERKRLMAEASWQSEYQQSPIIVGGGIFPIENLNVIPTWNHSLVKRSVRYWDKAGTHNAGKRTAGVLLHQLKDNSYVIEDVVKGQWEALERERRIKTCAQNDRAMLPSTVMYEVVVEQEPGSGGKESAEATIRNLPGFRVFADKVTGSKEIRAEPFAAQVQGNNVKLVAGPWVRDFIDEAETYPNGQYLDQIDAAAGAFNRMIARSHYNLAALAS